MLYKIDYTKRSGPSGSKWVNHATDSKEAVTRFMDNFFQENRGDAVRVDLVMEVEIFGDMSGIELIDEATKND